MFALVARINISPRRAYWMETPSNAADVPRSSVKWLIVALGLMIAGWATLFLIQGYAMRLTEQWGPAPDV